MEKGFYRHFKGNIYEVVGFASNPEDGREYVIYKNIYTDVNYIRRISNFNEFIVSERGNVKRFEYINIDMLSKFKHDTVVKVMCFKLVEKGFSLEDAVKFIDDICDTYKLL